MSTDARQYKIPIVSSNADIIKHLVLSAKMQLEKQDQIVFNIIDPSDRVVVYMYIDAKSTKRQGFVTVSGGLVVMDNKIVFEREDFSKPLLQAVHDGDQLSPLEEYECQNDQHGLITFRVLPVKANRLLDIINGVFDAIMGGVDVVYQIDILSIEDNFFFDNVCISHQNLS